MTVDSKHIYGPVPSRRLGLSLGIDIIPFKICTYNCVYCQLGATERLTIQRREYIPADQILNELKPAIETSGHIDYLTFSGSGEPTLHAGLGDLIRRVKKKSRIPVAVLTNASLIFRPEVQDALLAADVVLPTLSSTDQQVYKKIHQPHQTLSVTKIVHGLAAFRKRFPGRIWLEIMLLKGINDRPEELGRLKEACDRIEPDQVHLNTAVRPPRVKSIIPLSWSELKEIEKYFGDRAMVIADFQGRPARISRRIPADQILALIQRRPVTLGDLSRISGLNRNEIIKTLLILITNKKIRLFQHGGINYYKPIKQEEK